MAVEKNQVIVVVLHQPTSAVFDVVNKLYLLVEGGRQAFFGTKDEALHFFTTECHLLSSSLDGFIEQLTAPPDIVTDQRIITQKVAADQYIKSGQSTLLETTIKRHLESVDKNDVINKSNEIERGSFGRQLKWLLWRSLISVKHDPKRTTKLVLRLVIMALILGKTTLMNVLSGHYGNNLLMPRGNVYLNGILTTHSQRQKAGSIGYVEQQEFFIETMTLEEHLTFQVEHS
ncbi:unnamed protein product [Rotaria sp. Silwood2]|nr:unnamed protein product [Rotaria sp. Silwood2]